MAYHGSLFWSAIKNEAWHLNYRRAILAILAVLRCHPESSSVFVPSLLWPLSPPISLTHTSPHVYPSTSATRLTAIRHWPCSLRWSPLAPAHNCFLWFTVVGHCQPPKVLRAGDLTYPAHLGRPSLPPALSEAVLKCGLNYKSRRALGWNAVGLALWYKHKLLLCTTDAVCDQNSLMRKRIYRNWQCLLIVILYCVSDRGLTEYITGISCKALVLSFYIPDALANVSVK